MPHPLAAWGLLLVGWVGVLVLQKGQMRSELLGRGPLGLSPSYCREPRAFGILDCRVVRGAPQQRSVSVYASKFFLLEYSILPEQAAQKLLWHGPPTC
jgi:hypothetical protein